MTTKVCKNMPSNGSNVTDRPSTFILGRRAFNMSSHNSENLKKNLSIVYNLIGISNFVVKS